MIDKIPAGDTHGLRPPSAPSFAATIFPTRAFDEVLSDSFHPRIGVGNPLRLTMKRVRGDLEQLAADDTCTLDKRYLAKTTFWEITVVPASSRTK